MSTSVPQRQNPAAPLQLSLLGGFELRACGGAPICLANKTMLLLALLALSRGCTTSRDRLIGHLWSERAEPQARASLRQALWELRQALPSAGSDALRTDRAMISLDPQVVTVDVHRFEELVGASSAMALEEAANLYRGDLLDGVRITDPACEAWVSAERNRLRDLAINALDRLLDMQAESAPPERLFDAAHRLLALDALHEPAHRALMLLWTRQGRSDLALRQYTACREVLRRELAVLPQPETSKLADEIRHGRIPAAPTTASLAPSISNPQAPTERQVGPLRRRMVFAGALGAATVALVFAVVASIDRNGTPRHTDEPVMSKADASGGLQETERAELHQTIAVAASAGEDREAARVGEALHSALLGRLSELGRGESIASAADSGSGTPPRYKLTVNSEAIGDSNGVTVALVASGSERALSTLSLGPDLGAIGTVGTELVDVLLAHAAAAEETSSVQAAEAFARGWHHYRRHDLSGDRLAFAEFTRAIRRDPSFARAHAALAALYWRCWLTRCGWGGHLNLESWPAAWEQAAHHVEQAMQQPTPLAHQVASRMLFERGPIDDALAAAEQALALDPEDADSFANLAELRSLAGAPHAALADLRLVEETWLARSPLYPRALGRALFATARFSEAAAALEQAMDRLSADKATLELLAATYGHLGREAEATVVVDQLSELIRQNWGNPTATYRLHMAEFDAAAQAPGDRSLLLDGLSLAGVPE